MLPLILSATINTSDACDPGMMRATGFYPIDQATDVPLDSRIILKASGGLFEDFSFTVRTNDENVNGTYETDCINSTCYFIFVPDEPLMSETTYILESSSEEDETSLTSTFTTGTANAIINTQVPIISISDQIFVEADPLCGGNAHYNYQISISGLMVTDDQNTHIYLNEVDDTGTLVAVKKVTSVQDDPINISGAAQADACFTVSHVAQNGEILGESDIACTETTNLDDTGDPNDGNKGCSSMSQGPINWLSLLGLIGLSTRRRR